MNNELKPVQFTVVATTLTAGTAVVLSASDLWVTSGLIVPISTNTGTCTLGCVNTLGATDPRAENTAIVLPAVPGRVYNLKNYFMNAANSGEGALVFGHLA